MSCKDHVASALLTSGLSSEEEVNGEEVPDLRFSVKSHHRSNSNTSSVKK